MGSDPAAGDSEWCCAAIFEQSVKLFATVIAATPKICLLQTAKSGTSWQILSPSTWDAIPHHSSCKGVQIQGQSWAAAWRTLQNLNAGVNQLIAADMHKVDPVSN